MRKFFTTLSALLLTACGAADKMPTAPLTPMTDPPKNLSVLLDIKGDPSLAAATYALTLDGAKWRDAAPGLNQFSVLNGTHTVALAPFITLFAPTWCRQIAANSFSGQFTAAAPTSVTFYVECPPLTGTGTIRLEFDVSGSAAPTTMDVRFLRLNGPTISSSYTIPTNKPIDIEIPVGLYRIDPVTGTACKRPASIIGFLGYPVRAVYQAAATGLSMTFTCN